MKFPSRFNGINVESLPVKVVSVSEHNGIVCCVYGSLHSAAKNECLSTLVGPFADKLNNNLCIRFETRAACEILSQ